MCHFSKLTFNNIGWVVSASHEEKSADTSDSGDGVGHRHQGRVEGRDNRPNSVVTDDTTEKLVFCRSCQNTENDRFSGKKLSDLLSNQ